MIMQKLTPTMLQLLDCYADLDAGHLPRGTYPRSITRTRAALVERGLVVRARDLRHGARILTDEGRAVVLARAEVEAHAEDIARRSWALDRIERRVEAATRVPAATTSTGAPATLDDVERRIAVAERVRDDAQAMGHFDAATRACDLLDALVEQRRQLATASGLPTVLAAAAAGLDRMLAELPPPPPDLVDAHGRRWAHWKGDLYRHEGKAWPRAYLPGPVLQVAVEEARCDGCGAWPGLDHAPECRAVLPACGRSSALFPA